MTLAQGGTTDMSFIGLFMQAGPVVQGVMLVLVAASIIAWAAYYDAHRYLTRMQRSARRFERQFERAQSISDLMASLPEKPTDPKMAMLFAGISEWRRWPDGARRSSDFHTIILPRLEQTILDEGRRMLDGAQKKLPLFSTIGATAPFIGLFGTVWGVMNAFRAIGEIGSTSLAVVAPGIAEALLATGLGLLAAIPAVVFTNQLNQKLLAFEDDLSRFSRRVNLVFAQAYVQRGE